MATLWWPTRGGLCATQRRHQFLSLYRKLASWRRKERTMSSSLDVGISEPVNFSDTEKAFQSKSSYELWRTYAVFKLFQYDLLVDNSEKLLSALRRIVGKHIFKKIMKATIFVQFVVGEDAEEVKSTLSTLKSHRIYPILAYSTEDATTEERDSSVAVERGYDNNLTSAINCLNVVADSSEYPFSATKLTGLCSSHLLLRLSEALVGSEKVFSLLADQPSLLDGRITTDSFMRGAERMKLDLKGCEIDRLWLNLKSSNDAMNFFDWNDSFLSEDSEVYSLLVKYSPLQPRLPIMSEKEKDQMKSVMRRVETLADVAQERGVRLMVDAEQTYYQPAIRHVTVHRLMPKYNLTSPIIYNTQQCYLKNSYAETVRDYEATRHYGCKFGIKTVRGAYLHSERALVHKKGYTDPIWATKVETDTGYHRVLQYVLERVKEGRVSVMVAGHNEDTIKYALDRIASLQLNTQDGSVAFGQQFGMSDNLTFTLGNSGYMAYKYAPCGPVEDVIPYLIRRANENRSMLTGAVRERNLIATEIKRRFTQP